MITISRLINGERRRWVSLAVVAGSIAVALTLSAVLGAAETVDKGAVQAQK